MQGSQILGMGNKDVYELGFARSDPSVSVPMGHVIINNVHFYTSDFTIQ